MLLPINVYFAFYSYNKYSMKYKLLIFDLDGTLIDTLPDIQNIFNFVLKANNLPVKKRIFYKKNIGNGIDYLLKKCLPINFKGDYQKLLGSLKSYYDVMLNEKTTIFEGIVPVLNTLKKNNLKIAVVSNKLHSLAVKSVKKYFHSYDIDVLGAEGGFPRKPNPNSTIHIIRSYNLLFSDVLFVGDSIVDIQTAKNAKVESAAVLWGNGIKKDFISHNADYLLKKPSDILELL